MWDGALAGRWALLDYFVTDGRHYLVARAGAPPGRGLTSRERRILEHVTDGWANKAIAAAFDVAEGTVASHVSRTARKLGLPSRIVLAELHERLGRHAASERHRLRVSRWRIGTEERVVVGVEVLAVTPIGLTRAEEEVCRMLLSGSSNRDIARSRGSAERTIANQCASLYRKLAVVSRGELRARVTSLELARAGGSG